MCVRGVVREGFDVNRRRCEPPYAVDAMMHHPVAEVVGVDQRRGGVHRDPGLSEEVVPVPPQADVGHGHDPGNGTDDLLGLIHQHRVHGVHEPPVDLTRGVAEHEKRMATVMTSPITGRQAGSPPRSPLR